MNKELLTGIILALAVVGAVAYIGALPHCSTLLSVPPSG